MADQSPDLMAGIVQQIAAWKLEEKEWSRRLEEVKLRVNSRWMAYLDDLALTGMDREDDWAKLRAAVRGLVKRVTMRITPGKDRYHKEIACLVQFHHTEQTKTFQFTTP
jgi:hypothetical protein